MASSDAERERTESVRLMAAAFDQVLDRLPEKIDLSDDIRREVALFIVDRFRLGEHDPDRLSDLALAELTPRQGADQVTLAPGTEETESVSASASAAAQ